MVKKKETVKDRIGNLLKQVSSPSFDVKTDRVVTKLCRNGKIHKTK